MNEIQPHHLLTGWRPLPVLLKIIWILILIGAVSSLFGAFSVKKEGYMIFGENLYGMLAVSVMFVVSIVIPIILLIAMMKRFSWAWILGVVLTLFMAVNESFMIREADALIQPLLSQMPEEIMDTVPNFYGLMRGSMIAGIVLGILIDIFFLIAFLVKRKYFSPPREY